MPRKPLALAAALVALALQAPSAHAAIVPGQVIDGPSSNIQHFGDLDMAPDGTGALTYIKKVGISEDIFVSLFNGSSWSSSEDVSTSVTCNCAQARVAAGNGGRVVVTFVDAAGNLQAAVKPNAGSPFSVTNAAPGSGGEVVGDDVDMDPVSGVAYAVIDQAGGHVRATRLSGTTWTEVGGAATNIDGPTNDTGIVTAGEQDTARVAVDSSGNAVVAWPAKDGGGAGDPHVFVRRLNGTTIPDASIAATVPSFAGHDDSHLSADMVNLDGGGSANPWIVFRELFKYGAASNFPRDLARQLVGNTFGPAQALDGLPDDTPTEGAEYPQVDVNAGGQGIAGMPRQLSFQTFGSQLVGGTWATGFRLDAPTPTLAPFPTAAIADSGNGLLAWLDSSGSTPQISAREDVGGVLGAPFKLSKDGAGGLLSAPDAPIVASSSSAGAVGVGFGQSNGGSNTVVAAVIDLPQPAPAGGGGSGGGGANPPAKAVAALRGHVFAVRGRFVRIPIACHGTSTCKGTITLRTAKAVAAKKRKLKLGSARFSIPAGHTKRVKVKLSKKGAKLIRKHHPLKAVATIGKKSTKVTLKRKR